MTCFASSRITSAGTQLKNRGRAAFRVEEERRARLVAELRRPRLAGVRPGPTVVRQHLGVARAIPEPKPTAVVAAPCSRAT